LPSAPPSHRAPAPMLRTTVATALFAAARAEVYDVVMEHYTSGCAHGCLDWSKVPDFLDPGTVVKDKNGTVITPPHQVSVGSLFADGQVPAGIGASCAMPAAHAGNHECDCGAHAAYNETYILDSYAGPWCFCASPAGGNPAGYNTPLMSYCDPPAAVPEQINLQLAASDTFVLGFVTYEVLPSAPPVAILYETDAAANKKTVNGVSHAYEPPGHTFPEPANGTTMGTVPYIMSYIKFGPLKPRTSYTYKVKSGGESAVWSEEFTFRSAYDEGETKLLTYGDMGHSQHNCMANAKKRCAAGEIDAIVHMG
jgi:hypothetical protein